jgi:hypothetical protein
MGVHFENKTRLARGEKWAFHVEIKPRRARAQKWARRQLRRV